jgi:23S rRNA pseudouridine1911/1915/1917 synthase
MEDRVLTLEFQGTESQRLDHFLVSKLEDVSRSFLQGLIKMGKVTIDGKVVQKTGHQLDDGVTVQIIIPPPEPSHLIPEDIPLDIVFENNDLLIINKPPGIVVHPSVGHKSGTLVHAVLAHCPDLEGVGGIRRPGIVHRLDKDTSGVIIVAKNDTTHQFLQSQFKQRKVDKHYLALVDSFPPTDTGRIEAAIGRDSKNRQKMAVVPDNKGRMAITEFNAIEKFKNHTLLEVKILTGRTHQIRLHLAYLNCPVVGDRTYGHKRTTLAVERQLLHALKIKIRLTKVSKPQIFEAALPEDFIATLEKLRENNK